MPIPTYHESSSGSACTWPIEIGDGHAQKFLFVGGKRYELPNGIRYLRFNFDLSRMQGGDDAGRWVDLPELVATA